MHDARRNPRILSHLVPTGLSRSFSHLVTSDQLIERLTFNVQCSYLVTVTIECHPIVVQRVLKLALILFNLSLLQLHHEKRPRFVINRFITDRCRGDAGGAEAEVAKRQDNCGAGSFLRIANASRTEFLVFSHCSRSCSKVIKSGRAS